MKILKCEEIINKIQWNQLRIAVCDDLPVNALAGAFGDTIVFSKKLIQMVKKGLVSKASFLFIFLHELAHIAQQTELSKKISKKEIVKYINKNRSLLEMEADNIACSFICARDWKKAVSLVGFSKIQECTRMYDNNCLVVQWWMVDGDGSVMKAGEIGPEITDRLKNITVGKSNIDHVFSNELVRDFTSDADCAGIHEIFTMDALKNLKKNASLKEKYMLRNMGKACAGVFDEYEVDGRKVDTFSICMGASFNDRYFYKNTNGPLMGTSFKEQYSDQTDSFINASHHGCMQFLHSMDCSEGNRNETKKKILRWGEFCLDVFYNTKVDIDGKSVKIQDLTFQKYLATLSKDDVFFQMVWQMILAVPPIEKDKKENPSDIKKYIVSKYEKVIEAKRKQNELYEKIKKIVGDKINQFISDAVSDSNDEICIDPKIKMENDFASLVSAVEKEKRSLFDLETTAIVSEIEKHRQETLEKEDWGELKNQVLTSLEKKISENAEIANIDSFDAKNEKKWGYYIYLLLESDNSYSSRYYTATISNFFNGKLLSNSEKNWKYGFTLDPGSVALGSVCHMIQDSFASSHTRRLLDPFNLCVIDKKFCVDVVDETSSEKKSDICKSNGIVSLKDYKIVEDEYVGNGYDAFREYLSSKAMPVILFTNYVFQESGSGLGTGKHGYADIFVKVKEIEKYTSNGSHYSLKSEVKDWYYFTSNSAIARDCCEVFLFLSIKKKQKKVIVFLESLYNLAEIKDEKLVTQSGFQYGTKKIWAEKSGKKVKGTLLGNYEEILNGLMCYNLKEPIYCRISVLIRVITLLDKSIQGALSEMKKIKEKERTPYLNFLDYCNLHVNEVVAEMNAIMAQMDKLPKDEQKYKVKNITKEEIRRTTRHELDILNGWIRRLCVNRDKKLKECKITRKYGNDVYDDFSAIDEILVVKGSNVVPKEFERIDVNLNQRFASKQSLYLCYRRTHSCEKNQQYVIDVVAAYEKSIYEKSLIKDGYYKVCGENDEVYIGSEEKKIYLYYKKDTSYDNAIDEIRILKQDVDLEGFVKVRQNLSGDKTSLYLYFSRYLEKRYVIGQICVISGENAEVPSGFEMIDVDLNAGCGGGALSIFICYKKVAWNPDADVVLDIFASPTKLNGWIQENVNLNDGTKGRTLFLNYKKGPAKKIEQAVADIMIFESGSELNSIPAGYIGKYQDLNEGAGGKYLYIFLKRFRM